MQNDMGHPERPQDGYSTLKQHDKMYISLGIYENSFCVQGGPLPVISRVITITCYNML